MNAARDLRPACQTSQYWVLPLPADEPLAPALPPAFIPGPIVLAVPASCATCAGERSATMACFDGSSASFSALMDATRPMASEVVKPTLIFSALPSDPVLMSTTRPNCLPDESRTGGPLICCALGILATGIFVPAETEAFVAPEGGVALVPAGPMVFWADTGAATSTKAIEE